ncbi:MAG TPA: UDP-3-O-(3-hydroxymyristoyl)glucosamine N-acyltransferase [Chthoniobacterales bacterium]|nr:UDP-3-O-(3-hydroxymyristoyl)glucosamine N-acyltransferase [Chthoniobacterales bacterium]
MTFTLQELATLSGGELIGDPAQKITGAASLAEATDSEISFFGNPRYIAQLRKTRAAAVFVPSDFSEQTPAAQIRVSNPAKAFEQIMLKLAPKPIAFSPGVHQTAIVDQSARLGVGVSIQPYAVVEAGVSIGDGTLIGAGVYIGHETVIGKNCTIYPRVTIRERTRIGDGVVIHSGAVIAADGFGFESSQGRHEKVPQLGIVQIDDDVEIGANTTIDRARFGRTWIQTGAKIDNLVQVAHNVVIGKNTIIAAQTGIAGSVRIGNNVLIGGQAGIIGHIEIGDNTAIGAQSGVSKNISGGAWWMTPATPLPEVKEQMAWVRRLGKLFERVTAIEKKLGLR